MSESNIADYLGTLSDFLLRDLRSEAPIRRTGALWRLRRVIPRFRSISDGDVVAQVQKRHALDVLAAEMGATHWRSMRSSLATPAGSGPADLADLARCTRLLSDLVAGGLRWEASLAIVAREARTPLMRDVFLDLSEGAHSDIVAGLDEHPTIFPEFYRALVQAGVESGTTATALKRVAESLEKDAAEAATVLAPA